MNDESIKQASGAGITILGAGPAGLTAALVLGRNGVPCTLIDKHHSPRPKICGDGLSGKVLSTLKHIDPEISRKLYLSPFVTGSHGVRFYSPAGRMAEISFRPDQPGQPPGLVCSRQDFDHFLLQEVMAQPSVNYLPGFETESVARNAGGWLLSGKNGRLHKEPGLLMVATGTDRKLLGNLGHDLPAIGTEGIGVRAYFDPVTGSGEGHSIEIHFLKELLPWYFWIFPYQDGSANVGLALPFELARKRKESLRELLFSLINKYPHLRSRFTGSTLKGKIEAHRLPYFRGKMELGGDHYILLGDAAYLVDPFTGEGISNAMVSGKTAAELAVDAWKYGSFGQEFAGTYTAEVYRKLEEELALGLRLQQLARQPRLLNLVIGRAAKSEKVRTLLEEMLYSMNSKGKLSQPMFYLKLMLGI